MDVCSDAPAWAQRVIAWRMAVLWTFREPSMGRHVHREFMRSALLDLTPIIPATACYQRNYVETYCRSNVELGMALALGKRICVVGGLEHVFHTLAHVEHYATLEALLQALGTAPEPVARPVMHERGP